MTVQLAIDIGGTKTLAAVVEGRTILAERKIDTPIQLTPTQWCEAIADLVRDWRGDYDIVGLAVTGLVDKGVWSALNSKTLPVPDRFAIEQALQDRLRAPVRAFNDAQAAAWGEFRFGGQRARNLFYLTISTGIGGGAIVNGKLLTGRNGLAGHAGQLRLSGDTEDVIRIEDLASGQWMAAEASKSGYDISAHDIFERARSGAPWASNIIDSSAKRVALVCRNIQLLLAPEVFVVGGGIGLADGYLDRVRLLLSALPEAERPEIHASELGTHAGVIGAADHARLSLNTGGGNA
jgi:N-acetylmannosamine-6-phosphate 2-epimerase / N-acetylmannosamine kinase